MERARIFYIITTLYIIMHIIYLDKYPLVWDDTDFYSGPAYCFVREGTFRVPVWFRYIGSNDFLLVGRLHLYIQAIFIKVLSPERFSIFVSRLPSFLLGIDHLEGKNYV